MVWGILRRHVGAVGVVVGLSVSGAALAADPVVFTVTVGASSSSQGFSSITAPEDYGNIQQFYHSIEPNYTDTSAASIDINWLGVPVNISYNANDPTLTFGIHGTAISESFAGATREDSERMFRDYLKSNGGNLLAEIERQRMRNTPNSPVAGNPSSLQGSLVDMGFNGFTGNQTSVTPRSVANGGNQADNLMSYGVEAGSFTAGSYSGSTVSLPIGYTFRFDNDPNQAVVIEAPLSQTTINGAKAYQAALGVGYQFATAGDWAFMPKLSYGVIGSEDLGTAAHMTSLSVSGKKTFHLEGWDLTPAAMIGMVKSFELSAGDYSSNPEIQNNVLRTGLIADIPHVLFGQKVTTQVVVSDTRFYGTELFLNQYNTVGVSTGTVRSDDLPLVHLLRIGLTWTHGDDYDAVKFGFAGAF